MGRRADGNEAVPPATGWRDAVAPGLAEFEALARQAYGDLPEAFRALCGATEIRVAEFADDEALDGLGIEDPFELMGLFEGVGLAQGGAESWSGRLPNRVWLYRRAILDYWCEHEETLGAVIAHVLVHELGHHFGLSDEDMEALEAEAD